MTVYFKFKSARVVDHVSVDGPSISVANLKDLIFAKKKLAGGSDFDIVISNALTNEEYLDERSFVPRFSSVLVRRIPRPSVPIAVRDVKDSSTSGRPQKPQTNSQDAPVTNAQLHESSAEYDDGFGDDLYSLNSKIVPEPTSKYLPENERKKIKAPSSTFRPQNEAEKIKAVVETSSIDWQQQSGGRFAVEKVHENTRVPPGRSFPQQRESSVPPSGYVCHRCGVAGHFIQRCPTNVDPAFDKKKIRPPTGIPWTMLHANSDETYFLPTGHVAVKKPDEVTRQNVDVPFDFCCPLCKQVLKDAVVSSKCCFKSYCDKCIRNEIIRAGKCACGATNVLADDLLPNKTLRDAMETLLSESSQHSSITSSDNAGNRAHSPDMESSLYAHSNTSSPQRNHSPGQIRKIGDRTESDRPLSTLPPKKRRTSYGIVV